MEEDIVFLSDNYEIHPGHTGGFVLISVRTGEPLHNFSTVAEAEDAYEKWYAEEDQEA